MKNTWMNIFATATVLVSLASVALAQPQQQQQQQQVPQTVEFVSPSSRMQVGGQEAQFSNQRADLKVGKGGIRVQQHSRRQTRWVMDQQGVLHVEDAGRGVRASMDPNGMTVIQGPRGSIEIPSERVGDFLGNDRDAQIFYQAVMSGRR